MKKPTTIEEAIEILRKMGWCYEHKHPYSGAFDWIIVGKRMDSESYGPFPQGFVCAEKGSGDTVLEAVVDAMKAYCPGGRYTVDVGPGHEGFKHDLQGTKKGTQCHIKAEPDWVAIHLVDHHGWDSERARLWLRDAIEEMAFYDKP